MTPQHYDWSVASWGRYDTEPSEVPPFVITATDGTSWVVSEPMDPQWHAEHWQHGAEVHDARRGITYRATVDERGDLDHLEVVLAGSLVDDQALTRLSSVPVERIRRAANEQAIHGRRAGEVTFVPAGGLADGDGSLYSPPSETAILTLLEQHPSWWRQELAAHYGRPVRTVDRWLRAHGIKRASRSDQQTPGGNRPPGDRK